MNLHRSAGPQRDLAGKQYGKLGPRGAPRAARPDVRVGRRFQRAPRTGVVEGGAIPYLPAALGEEDERRELDEARSRGQVLHAGIFCAPLYMPYPFQIVQSTDTILMTYEFAARAASCA